MNIKGVIFDMDGVITETSEMHYKAWKSLAEKIGITFTKKENEALKGISRRASLMKILEFGQQTECYSETELLEMMEEKNIHYLSLIQAYTDKEVNPGILKFMQDLKINNIKIAIASASKSARFLIQALGLKSYVDYIVDPTSVPGKPEPDIFLRAADALGLDPSECVGVEDAQSGVQAIKSAHMYAIGIGDKKILIQADVVYSSTADLSCDFILNL
jgi:beta-phosphoglucomutase